MAKLMKKHGEDTPIQYDEFLFNLDPSAYEILDDSSVKPAKKAKADAPSGDLDFDT